MKIGAPWLFLVLILCGCSREEKYKPVIMYFTFLNPTIDTVKPLDDQGQIVPGPQVKSAAVINFEKHIMSDKRVKEMLKKFVLKKIFADTDEGVRLVEQYKIEKIPTIIFQTQDETEIARYSNITSPEMFCQIMQDILSNYAK